MKKNHFFGKVLIGLCPLLFSSIVTPITSCSNSKENETDKTVTITDNNEITYENLQDMRQNVLVNFSRLSIADQEKALEKAQGKNEYKNYSSFDAIVDAIFDNETMSIKDRYLLLYSFASESNLTLVDYIDLRKTIERNYQSFSESNQKKLLKEWQYCKSNFLTNRDATKRIDNAIASALSNNSDISSIKTVSAINLKHLVCNSVISSRNKSDLLLNKNKSLLETKNDNLLYMEDLKERGLLEKGTLITEYVKNQSIYVDQKDPNSTFVFPNYANWEKKDQYELYAYVEDSSCDFINGFWIQVKYGLIEKKYQGRLNSKDYMVWYDGSDEEQNNLTTNSLLSANDQVSRQNKFILYSKYSPEYRQTIVDNTFKDVVEIMNPHLVFSDYVGIENYLALYDSASFSLYDPTKDDNYLLFSYELENEQRAKQILDNFFFRFQVWSCDLTNKQVSIQIFMAPRHSKDEDVQYIDENCGERWTLPYRFQPEKSNKVIISNCTPSRKLAENVVKKINVMKELNSIASYKQSEIATIFSYLSSNTVEIPSKDETKLPSIFQYFGVKESSTAWYSIHTLSVVLVSAAIAWLLVATTLLATILALIPFVGWAKLIIISVSAILATVAMTTILIMTTIIRNDLNLIQSLQKRLLALFKLYHEGAEDPIVPTANTNANITEEEWQALLRSIKLVKQTCAEKKFTDMDQALNSSKKTTITDDQLTEFSSTYLGIPSSSKKIKTETYNFKPIDAWTNTNIYLSMIENNDKNNALKPSNATITSEVNKLLKLNKAFNCINKYLYVSFVITATVGQVIVFTSLVKYLGQLGGLVTGCMSNKLSVYELFNVVQNQFSTTALVSLFGMAPFSYIIAAVKALVSIVGVVLVLYGFSIILCIAGVIAWLVSSVYFIGSAVGSYNKIREFDTNTTEINI